MVPTLWIVLGPLGQSITAANLLGGVAHAGAAPPVRRPLCMLRRHLRRPGAGASPCSGPVWPARSPCALLAPGLPFSLTWWSFTFPVGTCVTAATGLALHTGADAFRWTAMALYLALVAAWAVVSARTARGTWQGRPLLPPPQERTS